MVVSEEDVQIVDFTTPSNENKSYEEQDLGEIAICVTIVVGPPPQRQ